MDIQSLVMDVDGTLTDGKIYMGEDGEVCKAFNIKDGYGIHDILMPAGIIPIIITGRNSKIVENRSRELGITQIYQDVKDKACKLKEVARELDIDLGKFAYIGDDNNDASCMTVVKEAGGVVGCPANATEQVLSISDFVSKYNGGNGAVRDFIEWIIKNNHSQNRY